MPTETMLKQPSTNAPSIDGSASPSQTTAWHTLPVDEAFQKQQTDVAKGLTQAGAAQRLVKFGPNALAQCAPAFDDVHLSGSVPESHGGLARCGHGDRFRHG